MNVQCTHQHGDSIPDEVIALGNTQSTRFDVAYGRDYVVFAISVWKGVIHYLVVNDQTDRPDWFPAHLFRVADPQLPPNWSFAIVKHPGLEGLGIWGYSKLSREDGQHYIDLIERAPDALQIFNDQRAGVRE